MAETLITVHEGHEVWFSPTIFSVVAGWASWISRPMDQAVTPDFLHYL